MPVVVAVALGGATGSVLRWWLAAWVARRVEVIGAGTFAVNIIGAFAIGLVIGGIESRAPGAPTWVRTGLSTGILGGFTTFSAFMYDGMQYIEDGRPLLAVMLILATVTLGLGAAGAGLALGRSL